MAEEIEKIYVIPLKKKNYRLSIAAPTAMKRMKQYLVKHMKVNADDIWIDAPLNHEIWKHGKFDMPNKIRVKAVKFEDGVVEVYLPEQEFTKSRREILQEEKAKKTPILLKEEESEEEMETGTEDYDVVPTADGDVKIKKKKHEKEDEIESSDEDDSVEEEDEPEAVEPVEEPSEEEAEPIPVEESEDDEGEVKSSKNKKTTKKENKESD